MPEVAHDSGELYLVDGDKVKLSRWMCDIKRSLFKNHGDSSDKDFSVTDANARLVSSICTRGISYRGQDRGLLTCYPDTDLAIAKQLMEAKGIKQLPVVKRGGEFSRERKRRITALLHYDSVEESIRFCIFSV